MFVFLNLMIVCFYVSYYFVVVSIDCVRCCLLLFFFSLYIYIFYFHCCMLFIISFVAGLCCRLFLNLLFSCCNFVMNFVTTCDFFSNFVTICFCAFVTMSNFDVEASSGSVLVIMFIGYLNQFFVAFFGSLKKNLCLNIDFLSFANSLS